MSAKIQKPFLAHLGALKGFFDVKTRQIICQTI